MPGLCRADDNARMTCGVRHKTIIDVKTTVVTEKRVATGPSMSCKKRISYDLEQLFLFRHVDLSASVAAVSS
jgi:hypothetical protein